MSENKKILVLSDLHRGAKISKYEGLLREAMERAIDTADHIVLNGDIFELFYVPKKDSIQNAIERGLASLTAIALAYPEKQIHFVLGNHENIPEFREGRPLEALDPFWNGLNGLARMFKNFEWHPEAIRIGDALFFHGDLQVSNNTDKKRPQTSMREAESHKKQTALFEILEAPGQAVVDYLRRPKAMIKMTEKHLQEREEFGDFSYSEDGVIKPFTLDGVRHVFTGHTHVPFKNEPAKHSDRMHHNSGGMTKGRGVKEIKDIQALSAELTPDGRVESVQRTFRKKAREAGI